MYFQSFGIPVEIGFQCIVTEFLHAQCIETLQLFFAMHKINWCGEKLPVLPINQSSLWPDCVMNSKEFESLGWGGSFIVDIFFSDKAPKSHEWDFPNCVFCCVAQSAANLQSYPKEWHSWTKKFGEWAWAALNCIVCVFFTKINCKVPNQSFDCWSSQESWHDVVLRTHVHTTMRKPKSCRLKIRLIGGRLFVELNPPFST